MDMEAQEVLKKAQNVKNQYDSETDQVKVGTRFFPYRERQEREEELKQLQATLNQPAWVHTDADSLARVARRKKQLERELVRYTPPQVSGEAKDVVAKRKAELEEQIRVGMPTQEEMRRNPTGAVDKHRKWEKAHKERILEWKNLTRVLEPDSDDIDLANIEKVRPSGLRPDGASTFYADAQIPGHFAQTPKAKENWPLGEPKVDTPLKQAERRETAEKKPSSPEVLAKRRAAAERARAAKKAKQAEAALSA